MGAFAVGWIHAYEPDWVLGVLRLRKELLGTSMLLLSPDGEKVDESWMTVSGSTRYRRVLNRSP